MPYSFIPVPDDVSLDGPSAAKAAPASKFVPVPDNIELDSLAPRAQAQPEDYSAARNFLTGLARIPGVILGAPRVVAVDLPNWATAKISNAVTGGNMTGADVQREIDRHSIIPDPSVVLPSAQAVDRATFGFLSRLVGHKVVPYEPTTAAGQIGQAAVAALGGGILDPVSDAAVVPRIASAMKSAIAGGAAEGTHQLFPNSDVAPIIAAMAAHGATTAGARAGRTVAGVAADTGRQIFAPTKAGAREAARTLARVDNTLPAIVQPSDAALTGAQANVQRATADIGSGVPGYQAGAQIRSDLAKREAELKQAREDLTAPTRVARDESTAFVNLHPVLSLINDKLGTAAGAQAEAIRGARQDLELPPGLREALPRGSVRSRADQVAASRQAIDARIAKAKNAGDNASALHLLEIRNALDKQFAAAVPEAKRYNELFSAASRPLDPFEADKGTVSAVPDAIARDRFGNFTGTPPSEIPDSFLRGPATREKMQQLVSAFGGDRDAALRGLEQFLAGKAQSAVNPDGTLNVEVFERVMAPYQKALGGNVAVWFPSLGRKFASAKAAQQTLETMQQQRALADAISTGALRDGQGRITGQSFSTWLKQNERTLARTQSPAAVMRLKQIATALSVPQGELADAIKADVLPTAVGVATGGTEGGIIGGLLRHSTHAAFGGLDANRAAAFNAAIERAVLDPAYAAKLTAKFGQWRARGLSPARALAQAVAAMVPALQSTR